MFSVSTRLHGFIKFSPQGVVDVLCKQYLESAVACSSFVLRAVTCSVLSHVTVSVSVVEMTVE